MFDARKILVVFLVGILYAIFTYSLIDAFFPDPEYQDYCRDDMMPMPVKMQMANCPPSNTCPIVREPQCGRDGMTRYNYSSNGCVSSITCDYCQKLFNDAQEKRNFIFFIFSAALGLIALSAGFLLPQKKSPINEWTATGFLLGGLITIFIGTAVYYGDMARIARPIVIFAELAIVIFLAYRQFRKK